MERGKRRVLFIGRFQPFHKGHESAIKALAREWEVVVGIGSSNVTDARNPFSAETRRKMVEAVFPGIEVHLIPDFESDGEWVEWVESNISFDAVATGNEWVWKCFEGRKPLLRIELVEPERYSGTRIRELMKIGGEWKDLVPERCVLVILNSDDYRKFVS